MKNPDVIIFTNLRQADQQIAGQTQAVKAIRPTAGHFSQPNAEGALWRPTSLGDVTARATARAARFREMFQ